METRPSVASLLPHGAAVRNVKQNNVGGDYNDNRVVNTNHVVNNSNIVQQISTKDWRLTLLEEHISKGAAHDSHERGGLDAPKCHPETRAAVQDQIMSWIGYGDKDETPTRIMWLSGPAGSGKTAIAGSICDTCQEKGWLAATFFFSAFSGPADRRSKLCLVPTLAYHLIHQRHIPGIRERILSAIADTPSVFEKRLADQIEILILEPLRGLVVGSSQPQWPRVIVVDGLDECGANTGPGKGEVNGNRQSQEASQREIISVLVQACKDSTFPFRVLLISRPEPAIRDAVSESSIPVTPLFLDDRYNPDADIKLFLQAKFTEIGRRYNIPKGWLTRDIDVVKILVDRASGQFIYAATVLRFIQDGKRSPTEQLKRVLEWKAYDSSEPFSSLDLLYLNIVNTSPNPATAAKWLIAIDMVRGNGIPLPGRVIRGILEGQPGEMDHLFGNLTSLVDFEKGDVGPAPSLNFYHKSFGDFLRDRSRSVTLHESLSSMEATRDAETAVQTFLENRVHQLVKRRGFLGLHSALPTGLEAVDFDVWLCWFSSFTITARHVYDPSDVEWWWSSLHRRSLNPQSYDPNYDATLRLIYGRVHKDCPWFKCRDTCKLWRRALRQRCRTQGSWHIPTKRDRLVEVFSPFYKEERIFRETVKVDKCFYPLRPQAAPHNPDETATLDSRIDPR